MDDNKLSTAISEADRFIRAARKLVDRRAKEKGTEYACYTTREGGACRRDSLDLTMALADLRRRGT